MSDIKYSVITSDVIKSFDCMSKFQLKRLVGWMFLQVGMKCETKVITYSPA